MPVYCCAMNSSLIRLANIKKTYQDEVALHPTNLEIFDGEFLTILGPSGCGKTTLLRTIAGFVEPDHGQVLLHGKDITALPPEARNINMVFQSYALFPHMNIFDNVAFGLRCDKVPEGQIKPKVIEALNRVKLGNLVHRKPEQLSGGQQQRVAIARALVKQPEVLLLDEPLSALDYHLRKQMRIELKALQRKLGITFILVTHDQEEALSLSDRIVVMDHGKIEQIGSPRDVYEEPVNLHVARFIGEANVFKTPVKAVHDDKIVVNICNLTYELQVNKPIAVNEMVDIVIRPEDIVVWGKREITEHKDMLNGVVVEVIYKGSTVDLKVQLDNKQIIAATQFFDEDDENLFYDLDEKVWVEWKIGWEVILKGTHPSSSCGELL